MQLLGLRCASEKSPKNARVSPPLLLQLLIAMALLVLQAMSTILQRRCGAERTRHGAVHLRRS
jgi:hypothetical protein